MSHGIAIVGMAGRFPGADGLEEFWANLRGGVESVTDFSEEELKAAGVGDHLLRDPAYVRRRAPLEGIAEFDAGFFGYSPKDAVVMDPQHRLFLECAWEALESAGVDPARFPGLVAVFAGASSTPYLLRLSQDPSLRGAVSGMEAQLGNDKDYLATRVSYKLDLKGPSMTVQTGCSTALVAIHLACQSLLDYGCDLALAGGVSVSPDQRSGYLHREGGIGSPDGHCRAFDADAAGTVGGSGLGVLVLKRLQEALEERDTIHAVVRGSAVNNDGSAKVGYTAPSVEGQAAVIRMAQAVAEVEPETVTYVEAHGTGTALGDPIEVAALHRVFAAGEGGGGAAGRCALGSVKTNIGHLDAAAGVAGVVKTVLAMRHREIPPSLHFRRPNPKLELDSGPFYVPTQARPWESNGSPRRAGVSSFGIGGTNAHLVLEEAPPPAAAEGEPRRHQLLVLSARSEGDAGAAARRLADHLEPAGDAGPDLADVARTLQLGRHRFRHRRAVVVERGETAAAVKALRGVASNPPAAGPRCAAGQAAGGETRVAFLFPGQGAQHPGMGQDLYEAGGVFRETVDRCAALAAGPLERDLAGLLYPPADRHDEAAALLRRTELTQPALFAVEIALARQWQAWGVTPFALLGHSIGEYAAACLAGVMTLEEAVGLVVARGRLMGGMPAGAMLAVPLSEAEVAADLPEGVVVAAVNAPDLTVLSGPADALGPLGEAYRERGLEARPLHTSHAFHSPVMEGIREPFLARLGKVGLKPPRVPFLSNLTGTWIESAQATDPEYWLRQALSPVRFAAGVDALLQAGARVLLEVGPGQSLTSLARRCLDAAGEAGADEAARAVPSLDHPRRKGDDDSALLTAAGALWTAGVEPDWAAVGGGYRGRRVPLPTYPFDRRPYWFGRNAGAPVSETSGGVGVFIPSWKRLPPAVVPDDAVHEDEAWLILADQRGVGDSVARRLRRRGAQVWTVVPAGASADGSGDGPQRLGPEDWALDPERPGQWHDLVAEITAGGPPLRHVVHMWSIDDPGAGMEDTGERFQAAQVRGLYSLLHLGQAAAKNLEAQGGEGFDLTLVTEGVHAVSGDEERAPRRAPLLAVAKVLPQEILSLTCHAVDLPPEAEAEAVADAVVAAAATRSGPPLVALRGRHRWVESFEPAELPAGGEAVLRHQGVYLITGGTGRLGLVLARNLARDHSARLALLGRRALPPRERWEEIADGAGEAARQARRLLEIEAAGGEILGLSGDVASRADMEAAVAAVEERFGSLHGVIHAAGHARGDSLRAFMETSPGDCQLHFAAKVTGTRVLAELLAGRDLDFCLVTSSLASVLGGLGFTGYAAAHLYVDAYVEELRRRGEPWLAVNFDAWGLGDDKATPDGKTLGEGAAMGALERLLTAAVATGTPRYLVAAGDLQQRLENWLNAGKATAGGDVAAPRRDLDHDAVEPRDEVERRVAEVWQELLGVDVVGVEDDFFALGGHSLIGLHLMARLRGDFEVPGLQLNDLFEEPTVAALARHIRELRPGLQGAGVDGGGATAPGSPVDSPPGSPPDSAPAAVRGSLPDSLVPFLTAGEGRPFFCVHPIGGHVFRFQKLARHLGDDRPFWGLQARGLSDLAEEGEHHQDIGAMAAEYLDALRHVQPEGPYLLGGWSFGGFVAYEMAQQAEAAGLEVALLTIIDAPSPGNFAKLGRVDDAILLLELARQRGRKAGHRDLLDDETFSKLEGDERFSYVLDRLKAAELVPPDIDVGWLRHYVGGYRDRERAGREYEPQPYSGRLLLFRARDIDGASLRRMRKQGVDFEDPSFGWGDLVSEIDVVSIPGFHETIVQEPNVHVLADELRRRLNRADREPS